MRGPYAHYVPEAWRCDVSMECVARLDWLGAKVEADAVRLKLTPKTRKSDLPK
jgi:hypothetical protein